MVGVDFRSGKTVPVRLFIVKIGIHSKEVCHGK